jgi:phosphotransferase system HPr-like phosphotransfer protein
MANGDKAAAAGLAVFAATDDRRLGYDNDNVRGDELATHMTTGTHPMENIVGLDAALAAKLTKTAQQYGSDFTFRDTNIANALGTAVNAQNAANAALNALPGKRDLGNGQFGDVPIYTPHGRNNPIASSWVSAGIGPDGRIAVSSSSRRYKENITDADLEPADVLQLRAVEFDRIGGGHELGLIAEEVDEHLPAIVVRTGDRIDGVHYHLLPVALLRVVQDQQRRIDALAARLDALALQED